MLKSLRMGETITNVSLPLHNRSLVVVTSSPSSYGVMHDDTASYEAIIKVQTVVIPILCFIGLIGNGMAIRILVAQTLRKKSCCLYLTTKCLTDSVFMASLFVVWMDRIKIPWFHYHGVCQIIIFTTYVCAFTSIWLVVMVTAENYIRICHPHIVRTLCTVGKAKALLMTLGLVSIFCYQFPLWTVHSIESDNMTRCALIPEYERFNNGLTYFDTAITLFVPLVLVVLFMTAIFHTLWSAFRRNQRMKKLGRHRETHFLCLSPYGRVTAMLLAVSLSFIVLHSPSHIIRLQLLITQVIRGNRAHFSIAQLRLQRLFELLYYSNFSINWLIYYSFGKQFRYLYNQQFCSCLHKKTLPARKCNRTRCTNEKMNMTTVGCLDEGVPCHDYASFSLPNMIDGEEGEEEEDVVVTELGQVSSEYPTLKPEHG